MLSGSGATDDNLRFAKVGRGGGTLRRRAYARLLRASSNQLSTNFLSFPVASLLSHALSLMHVTDPGVLRAITGV